jgi:hypothetical protein
MLLTENIVLRVHEWLDRHEEPDLVPRLRRVWREAALTEPLPRTAAARAWRGKAPSASAWSRFRLGHSRTAAARWAG